MAVGRINCAGNQIRTRDLQRAVTTRFYLAMVIFLSLGRAYGNQGFLLELLSLFGLQLW